MSYEYQGKTVFPILKIKPTSFKQLQQKYPVFELCIQKTYDIDRLKVTTKKIKDGVFEILDGYGELTGGLILENEETQ